MTPKVGISSVFLSLWHDGGFQKQKGSIIYYSHWPNYHSVFMCMNLEPRMDHFVAGTGRRAAVRILPGRLSTARAVTTLSPGLSRTTSSILEVRTSSQVTDQIWVICMTILFGLSVCTRVLITHLEPELN